LEYHRVPAASLIPEVYPHPNSQRTIREQQQRGETSHWFKVVDYATACRRDRVGSPFDELLEWMTVLPNVRARGCSAELKIRTMMRYLFSLGIYNWHDYIGIRNDEAHRATEIMVSCGPYRHPVFPLVSGKKTVLDVNRFWQRNSFDLHLQSHEGNCDLCFLKAKWKRISIIREHPEYVKWWEGWEDKRRLVGQGGVFRQGESFASLHNEATHPEFSFTRDAGDIACGCADGAFKGGGDIDCAA
jgi:hypothetical protein